jgi:hypothetical protein
MSSPSTEKLNITNFMHREKTMLCEKKRSACAENKVGTWKAEIESSCKHCSETGDRSVKSTVEGAGERETDHLGNAVCVPLS